MTFHHNEHEFSTTCLADDFLAEGSAAGPSAGRSIRCEGSAANRTTEVRVTDHSWDTLRAVDGLDAERPALGAETHNTLLTSPRSWVSAPNRAEQNRQPPKQLARTCATRWTRSRENKLNCSERPRETGLYIAMDRPSVQFAFHDIIVRHGQPKCEALGRAPPSGQVHVAIPGGALGLRVPTHTNITGSPGRHWLDCSVAKQTVVALSSGASEFYGIVRAAAVGIQSHQLLCQLGVPLHLDILCDSSAAREICTRSGSGKVRHLTIKEQWMQEALRKGVLNLRVVDTLLCRHLNEIT